MPGLNFDGVPNNLKNTSFPFPYNNFDYLSKLIIKKKIGIIKMEVMRNILPKNNFLKKIRKLCDQKKIILIFDECTTGYRENMGGIHLNFNVSPDIAIFGKALGNGFAINAIVGKREIMQKIHTPLENLKQEQITITNQKKHDGMTGDSMVDEADTYWHQIQSTICELGPDFE